MPRLFGPFWTIFKPIYGHPKSRFSGHFAPKGPQNKHAGQRRVTPDVRPLPLNLKSSRDDRQGKRAASICKTVAPFVGKITLSLACHCTNGQMQLLLTVGISRAVTCLSSPFGNHRVGNPPESQGRQSAPWTNNQYQRVDAKEGHSLRNAKIVEGLEA